MKLSAGRRWTMVAVLLAAVLAAGYVAAIQELRREVAISSQPSGAAVFVDGRLVGETPVTFVLRDNEPRTLRLVLKGRLDVQTLLSPASLPESAVARIAVRLFGHSTQSLSFNLPSAEESRLVVTSEPAGCDVYLDGRLLGTTPLSVEGVRPGQSRVQITDAEGQTASEDVQIDSGAEARVHLVLADNRVAYYRAAILSEPGALTNYAELAHLLTLQGKFSEAGDALRAGFESMKKGQSDSSNRFVTEIQRIYVRYFHYPEETEDNRIAPICREIVEQALREKTGNEGAFRSALRAMDAYDRRRREEDRNQGVRK